MNTRWIALLIGFVAIASPAFGQNAQPSGDLVIDVQQANPFTSTPINNDPRHFQFAIVADNTGGMRPGVFASAVKKLNLLQPQFVMSVGDLIEGYTEDASIVAVQRDAFDALVRKLDMPFFYTVGNHDMANPMMAAEWQKRYGRSYYHFIYRNVLFAVVCTEDGAPGRISDEQVNYFRGVFAANPDVRWTMVFMHKPLWEGDRGDKPKANDWTPIADALGDRPYTVFAGHYHTYLKYQRRGHDYYTLATTGGVSRLTGTLDGQFEHLVWVTMTDQGPRLANLMLDGIHDEDIRDEKLAAMVDAIRANTAVSVEPIFADSPPIAGPITTTLRLANRSDCLLHVSGTIAAASPDKFDVKLAPGQQKEITVKVESSLPVAADTAVAAVNWSAVYDLPDRDTPLTITGTEQLAVNTINPIARRTSPVTVDGKLDDWSNLPIDGSKPRQILNAADQWRGPDDNRFRFAVERDDQFVYLAVEVIDDQVEAAARAPWTQDGIEIRLDARPDPQRSANRGRRDFTDHLFIALVPGEDAAPLFIVDPAKLPAGTQYACRRSDGGFNAEVAIPLDYFAKRQGAQWNRLRLNIAVDDRDPTEPAKQWSQIWWQPDWRTDQNLPGSGTFELK